MERQPHLRHHLARLLLCLAILGTGGVIVTGVIAQNDPKKEEEEERGKQKVKPRIAVEGEDESGKANNKVMRNDDAKANPRPELEGSNLIDLAKQAKSPFVRDFLFPIAKPHDIVYTKSGRSRVVVPVEVYLGKPPAYTGLRKFQNYDLDWKPENRKWEATKAELSDINYYEQLVLIAVDQFLEPLKDPSKAPPVPALEMLRVSEAALAAALLFNESARNVGTRKGEAFEDMAAAVRKRLFDVQVRQLELLAEGNWTEALDLAKKLAGHAPKPEDQSRIAGPLAKVIDAALSSGALTEKQTQEMGQRLRDLEDQFPASAEVRPIQARLQRQARALFVKAEALKEKDPDGALKLFQQAEMIWPRLAGLQDAQLTLKQAYPILRVGVRDLPVYLAPTHATLESEKLAVELLFEGLVKATRGASGLRYEPALAEGPPKMMALGRQFKIAPGTYWSNGEPVTAMDVRHTVRLLKNPKWAGCNPALAKMLDDVQVGGEVSRVSVTLKQGFVDPLSLMTFKVLPAVPWPEDSLGPEDDEKFAKAPVGSGPYQYRGPGQNRGGRATAVFVANPNYGTRPGRGGQPSIREIQMIQSPESLWAKDLKDGVIDVLTDVPSAALKDLQEKVPDVTVVTQPTRRIHFLAVNHRRSVFQGQAGQDLRVALAHAINRKELLDKHFRKGVGPNVHHELTGPFPAGSWACDPGRTYNPVQARLAAANLKNVELELKFSTEDASVRAVLVDLCSAVETALEGKVKIALKGVTPRELKSDVEVAPRYDLAYYSYDFPSDAFWLWPLFDPDGTGAKGTNYMGYANDGRVEQLFRDLNAHRDFRKLRDAAHTLHGELFNKMPLIPLWQLDRHVVLSKTVQAPSFDPLLIFADIEKWRLGNR